MTQPAARKQKKRKRGAVVALILAVAAVCWWCWLTAPPTFDIPTTKPPVPNAFDIYRAAGKLVALPDDIDDDLVYFGDSKWFKKHPVAEREQLLTSNAKNLAMVRYAFRYLYFHPPIRYDQFPVFTNEFRNFRRIGSLLKLDALDKTSRGNWPEAAQCDLDDLRFTADTSIGRGYSRDIVDPIVLALSNAAAHLDSGSAFAAERRLSEIESGFETFSDRMSDTQATFDSAYKFILSGRDYPRSAVQATYDFHHIIGIKDERFGETPLLYLTYLTIPKRSLVADTDSYWQAWARRGHESYVVALGKPYPSVPPDPISDAILNVQYQCMGYVPPEEVRELRSDYEARTNVALTVDILALRAYYCDHGEYPQSLAALVPQYLPRLPDDPYATNALLKYRRNGNSYVLYSIGPNEKDDGGVPLGTGNSDECCTVASENPGSTGDVVAGPNGLLPVPKVP